MLLPYAHEHQNPLVAALNMQVDQCDQSYVSASNISYAATAVASSHAPLVYNVWNIHGEWNNVIVHSLVLGLVIVHVAALGGHLIPVLCHVVWLCMQQRPLKAMRYQICTS